jgi:hypothetical protein
MPANADHNARLRRAFLLAPPLAHDNCNASGVPASLI